MRGGRGGWKKVCWKCVEVSGRGVRVSESVPACLEVAGKDHKGVQKGFNGAERDKE